MLNSDLRFLFFEETNLCFDSFQDIGQNLLVVFFLEIFSGHAKRSRQPRIHRCHRVAYRLNGKLVELGTPFILADFSQPIAMFSIDIIFS